MHALKFHSLSRPIRVQRLPIKAMVGSLCVAVTSQAMLVVSGVISARVLGPEQRGYLALIVIAGTISAVLSATGAPAGVTYFLAHNSNLTSRKSLVALLPMTAAQALAALGLYLVGIKLFLDNAPSSASHAAAIGMIVPLFMIAQSYCLAILQGYKSFKLFNIARLLSASLYALTLIPTTMAGYRSLTSIVWVWALTVGIATLLILLMVLREILRSSPRHEHAVAISRSDTFRFGLKSFLGSSSTLETFRIDQALIGISLSPSTLGIYTAAASFTNLPRLFTQNLGLVAYPTIAGTPSPKERTRLTTIFVGVGLFLSGASAILLALSSTTLAPLFFGSAFADSARVMQILLLASVFNALRRLLGDCLRGLGKPSISSWSEFFLITTMLMLLPLAIKSHGLSGAAWGYTMLSLASLLLMLLLTKSPLHNTTPSEHTMPSSSPKAEESSTVARRSEVVIEQA